MYRREVLLAVAGSFVATTGCLSEAGDTTQAPLERTSETTPSATGASSPLPHGLTNETLTSCEATFVTSEKDYGTNTGRPRVESVETTADGVRAVVESEWGKKTPPRHTLRFEAADDVDDSRIVVSATDSELTESDSLQRALSDAASGTPRELQYEDEAFDSTLMALDAATDDEFGGDESRTVYVDYEGTPVEVAYEHRPPLYADYRVEAYYYVTESGVYRTENRSVDPTDGLSMDWCLDE
ncbi:hypothetical protein GJR96_07155 [Haloferax sp. MBLA0076]|uniref:Lipoprotein n=1 Tax=Haloferax litoreum TaxID=2666140 RepID=A0A6A8GGW9_9EURY|nr:MULTISPECIES: hypothetical protein [Haloferax]KAB1193233.1 hypothetical protein Hfx1148_07150 [Haloferax sp. CBA1148]MRX21732.1 hypothetical protein [Haloferax litoreum]